MGSIYYAKGSYGNVYKQDDLIIKEVPIKYIDTLFNEIAIIRMINSEYAPKLISSSIDDKSGRIILPYYGINLSDYIRSRELSLEDKHKLIFQLLTGICDIHSSDIAHCDIKPNNIVVDDKGKLTIIDFGVSRSHVENVSDYPIKFALDGYGSPETYLGYRPLSKISDMWSIGCVIYYILYGKHLFETSNYMESVISMFGIPTYFKDKHKMKYMNINRVNHNIDDRLKSFFEFEPDKRINCCDAYKLWNGTYYVSKHIKQHANLYVLSAGSNIINDLLRAISNVDFDSSDILPCVNIILQTQEPNKYIYPILYIVGMLYNGMNKESIIKHSAMSESEFYSKLLYIITNTNLNII